MGAPRAEREPAVATPPSLRAAAADLSPARAPAVQPTRPVPSPAPVRRIRLDLPPDARSGELGQGGLSVPAALLLALVGALLLFRGTSWFIDYTRGEMRAMAEVVDRLALPPTACVTCDRPYRIVALHGRPFYDAPTERRDLLDPERAAESARHLEELRQQVRDFKAWSLEQRASQSEDEVWHEPGT